MTDSQNSAPSGVLQPSQSGKLNGAKKTDAQSTTKRSVVTTELMREFLLIFSGGADSKQNL